MGHLEVVCGSMFSGKSEELIRRVRRAIIARRRVGVFKPSIDTRYNNEAVASHNGTSVQAVVVPADEPWAIWSWVLDNPVEVVGIDEAQFFDPTLMQVVDRLIQHRIRVIVAGLDMDFAGRPFGVMPHLMAVADDVTKLKAICARCGEPATFNQRLVEGKPAKLSDPLVLVGGGDRYEARCRRCFEAPQ